jgi:hypothetical protein
MRIDAWRHTDAVVRIQSANRGFQWSRGYIELHDTITPSCFINEASIGAGIKGTRFSGLSGTAVYAIEVYGSANGGVITENYFTGWATACARLGAGASGVAWFGNGIADLGVAVVNQNTGNGTNNFIYQEYTWTPKLCLGGVDFTTNGGAGTLTGEATQIGDRLLVDARGSLSALGTGTGAVTVENWPFAGRNTIQQMINIQATGGFLGLTGVLQANIGSNTKVATVYQSSATGQTAITHAVLTNSSNFNLSGQYRI